MLIVEISDHWPTGQMLTFRSSGKQKVPINHLRSSSKGNEEKGKKRKRHSPCSRKEKIFSLLSMSMLFFFLSIVWVSSSISSSENKTSNWRQIEEQAQTEEQWLMFSKWLFSWVSPSCLSFCSFSIETFCFLFSLVFSLFFSHRNRKQIEKISPCQHFHFFRWDKKTFECITSKHVDDEFSPPLISKAFWTTTIIIIITKRPQSNVYSRLSSVMKSKFSGFRREKTRLESIREKKAEKKKREKRKSISFTSGQIRVAR